MLPLCVTVVDVGHDTDVDSSGNTTVVEPESFPVTFGIEGVGAVGIAAATTRGRDESDKGKGDELLHQ